MLWVLSPALLALLPDWLPSPPLGGVRAWWSWALADPQQAIVLAAGCLAMLFAAWLFVLTSLVLSVAADPSGRAVRRAVDWLTPRFARGLVRAALCTSAVAGTAVAVGPAAPALAAGSPGAHVAAAAPSLSPVPPPLVAAPPLPTLLELDRPGAVAAPVHIDASPPRPQPRRPGPSTSATATELPVTASPSETAQPTYPAQPTRPAQPTHPAQPSSPVPAAHPPEPTHTVRPGDTLWGLAAAELPAASSPGLITRAWQHWYEINRATIGGDPDLLLVGERLVIPPAAS